MPITFDWTDPVTLDTDISNLAFHQMFAAAFKERMTSLFHEGFWDEYQVHHSYAYTNFDYMAITPDVSWPINAMNGSGDYWPWDFTIIPVDGIKLYQNALFGKWYDGRGGVFESGISLRFVDIGAYNATGEVKPYTYATLRAQAGLNAAGFTRAKDYNPDGTPVVCGYGPIQDGDIIGPWIYNEIKACINLLKWRKEQPDLANANDASQIRSSARGWDMSLDDLKAEAVTNQITEAPYFLVTCQSYVVLTNSGWEWTGSEGDAYGHWSEWVYYGEGEPVYPESYENGWYHDWIPGPEGGPDWTLHTEYEVGYTRGKVKWSKLNLPTGMAKTVEFHVVGKKPADIEVWDGNGDFTAQNQDLLISTHTLDTATTSCQAPWFGTTATIPVWAATGTVRGYGTYTYHQQSESPHTFYCLVKYGFQYS